MRNIGVIQNHDEALLAGAHIVANGVQCRVEEMFSGSGFGIWVFQEDQMPRARELLEQFHADPDKDRYRESVEKARKIADLAESAQKLQEEAARLRASARPSVLDMSRPAPMTWSIISVCSALWLIVALKPELQPLVFGWLQIGAPGEPFMQAIFSGEVWRALTPALLHAPLRLPDGSIHFMGAMHILFNMLMLNDFGGIVERREGGWKLFWLFLLFSTIPNCIQYYYAGPNFVGMSGVVFALLAYLWMRGKYDPTYGLRLNPGIIWFAMIWFIYCLTRSDVANYVHAGGLVTGGLIGLLCAQAGRRRAA